MSMRNMGKRGTPKGALESTAKRAIVAFLRVAGHKTMAQIEEALVDTGAVAQDMLDAQPHWLITQLHRLREQGHIEQETFAMRPPLWCVAHAATRKAQQPPMVPGIAAPRRVSMFGPAYQPPQQAPARVGAMDHAAIPSRVGEQRVPFGGAS